MRDAALTALVSLFLAYTGAFGSGAAPPARRYLYWFLAIGTGAVIGRTVAGRVGRSRWPRHRAAQVAAVALGTAIPATVAIWVLNTVFFAGGRFEAGMLPAIFPPVLVITAVMVTLNALLMPEPAPPPAPPQAAAPRAPDLRDRLPAKLRGAALHAVQAEDHYLRVHTSGGSDLILLRLADALRELDGIDGAQTHRSWWVARAAVLGVARAEGRISLHVAGDLTVPVSRGFAPGLRAKGWI